MSDSKLFTSGALFTHDYLSDAVRASAPYRAVDTTALRTALTAIAAAFPQAAATNESQTEDDFIWPVLTALGWTDSLRQQNLTVTGRDDVPDGLMFADSAAKAAANALPEQWRRYAHGLAVVESKRWARPLDRASGRDETTAPSTQMLRYLRRIDDLTSGALRWGILTNGLKWRLYWAGARSISEEFLEIDLGRVLGLGGGDLFANEAARDHWLRVFAIMFARDAFVRDGADRRSFHERARAEAAFYEERVAASLSKLVFETVFPTLATAIADAAPAAPLPEVRNAALVLLYRLLFLLYAEDRDLLPVNDARYDDYALRPLRLDVGRRLTSGDAFSTSAARIWGHVQDLARIIDIGDAAVGIPPYNGGLFAQDGVPLFATIRLPDSVLAPVLDALSYERSSGERRYINYRDLSVQQLGSIYERLLEFELVREEGGTLAVRPNLFARKNSGSYYTPDELVGLILDETLEPLITERMEAFRTALAGLNAADAEDYRRRLLREVDPANAILSLKVCDPAMGSGHFLVSLVDTLADHVLEAMAEAAVLGAELAYVSPLAERIEDIRTTILRNARAANWAIDPEHLDDRHIVRRMVLKRCVYGVDKNPMAVELAKVALWLHTFTVGAPLSFIDHHLRCGDSLFGLWVRDAIDKSAGQGGGLMHFAALSEAQSSAAAMQVIERLTDVEIAEAHQSAATFYGIQAQTAPLEAFVSTMHALDWLDLRQPVERAAVRAWLDGVYGDPILIMQGRVQPVAPARAATPEETRRRGPEFDSASMFAAFERILGDTRALIAEERFLNWQVAFPGVWQDWSSLERSGGFDAVVGNPPWDMLEFEEVPWFEARDRAIALEQSHTARRRRIETLRQNEDPLWLDYGRATKRATQTLRMARTGTIYTELNTGRINLFKLFVERAHALIHPRGVVGLLTPSGIASDLSAAAFFRRVATGGHLKSLYDFENRRNRYGLGPFFPDVHSSFKFCVMVASRDRTFEAAHCGFYLQSVSEVSDPNRCFAMTAADFARMNPNTGTAPTFRNSTDMRIASAMYERRPVLEAKVPPPSVRQFHIVFDQMLNMATDSDKFVELAELTGDRGAWREQGSTFRSAEGRWLPVFEGKMVQGYDHRASDIVIEAENLFRPGQSEALTLEEHADPSRAATPRYWVQEGAISWSSPFDWCLAFKDITASTNVRTSIAMVLPKAGAGHTLPVAMPSPTAAASYPIEAPLFLAMFNSLPYDYLARQKVHGTHLSWYLLEQLPVIPPTAYARNFGPKTAADIVRESVLELSYTARDLAPFARDMGHVGADGEVLPPFAWDEERRLKLRARLDALFFILYGIFDPEDPAHDPSRARDDVRYIWSTFPIVEREDTARWGRYRSRDLCLAWLNALAARQPDADIAG